MTFCMLMIAVISLLASNINMKEIIVMSELVF